MSLALRFSIAGAAIAAVALVFTFQAPRVDSVQRGYRGTGMDQLFNRDDLAKLAVANAPPEAIPSLGDSGDKAGTTYQNVKVVGDVSVTEFTRLMLSITQWVSPEQGCNYCHNPNNMASDELYTKVVSRRMLQMVKHINADWKPHVAETGVTCYSCHRGQPVPRNIWFQDRGPRMDSPGKNLRSAVAGNTSLPYDPFTPFLEQDNSIRVQGVVPLAGENRQSIKQTDWTYSLMMHMSTALGVNCTYCHNTRQFGGWQQSSPQRTTAWHGIRLVRDLNQNYLDPLKGVFPAGRLGVDGDVPKVNCATCHNGVYKPLFGASLVADYPELK